MYKLINLKKVIFTMLLGFLFASCLTNVDEEQEIDPCTTVSFALDVKPLIDANCVSCHGVGGQSPNLTTYNSISANAATVKSEVVSKEMPIGGSLTDAEIQAISCWVDNGALNN